MSHHHNHSHLFGAFTLVAAIAFAFGMRTAQVIVGSVLLVGLAFFAYIGYRVVMGTI